MMLGWRRGEREGGGGQDVDMEEKGENGEGMVVLMLRGGGGREEGRVRVVMLRWRTE